MRDLDLLTIGLIMDVWTEKGNDNAEEESGGVTVRTAGQEDFDRFR